LIVSNVLPLVESTHFPSISIFVCRTFTGAFADADPDDDLLPLFPPPDLADGVEVVAVVMT
jgi:hypothetical protein